MRSRRRSAPSSPAALAQARAEARAEARARDADPAAWGLNTAALTLPANHPVCAARAPGGGVARAHRQDVLDRLFARGALSEAALSALRRLQADLVGLHRTGLGVTDFTPRVDGQRHGASPNDARLDAGRRIRLVLNLTGPASARLVRAFCEAASLQGVDLDWRTVVKSQTAEHLPDAQAAVLRTAADNLAGAYQVLDRERRAARSV